MAERSERLERARRAALERLAANGSSLDVGDVGTERWVVDHERSFPGPSQPGMQIVIDLDGSETELVEAAAEAQDVDFVTWAKRVVVEAARAAAAEVAGDTGASIDYTHRADRASHGVDAMVREASPGWLTQRKSLTIPDAAQRYGVKRERLQRAAMEGRLRAEKLGEGKSHPWLVHPEDVEYFLATSRRGPRKRRSA